MSTEALPPIAATPFRFLSRVEAIYPNEGLFSYDLPRQAETWGLRIFPQLLCAESLVQAAQLFLQLSAGEVPAWNSDLRSIDLDQVRFNGAPRPGDRLVLKLRVAEPATAEAQIDGEVWVHHRMVAQARMVVVDQGGQDLRCAQFLGKVPQ
ncbi:MAG: hypothetical protein VX498_05285 [Myxococcota bacterium]|nr:hypothetical protein [Myxococcota bacterium]